MKQVLLNLLTNAVHATGSGGSITVDLKRSGNGVGLFVSRSIIEKLGGEISVESKLGQGTRFCIRFPTCYEPGKARKSWVQVGGFNPENSGGRLHNILNKG